MKSYLFHTLILNLLFLMLFDETNGINVQGYLFEVYMNTSIVNETFDFSQCTRDVNDCASYCLLTLGQENCEVASFDTLTKSCRISSHNWNESTFVEDFSSVTISLLQEVTTCGSPTVTFPNLTIVSHESYPTSVGSTVFVECNDTGYVATSTTLTCEPSGEWQPDVKCDIVDCGVPTISNSNISNVNTVYGSTVQVTCSTGYDTNIYVITCQANGSWTHSECLRDCGLPDIAYGGFVNAVNTLQGGLIEVLCELGYIATEGTIECQANGLWTDVQCLKDCGPLTVPNAVTSYITNNTTYEGSMVKITCSENYAFSNMESEMLLNCTDSLGWTNQNGLNPECWELMFRGTVGNGYNLSDIYLYGTGSSHSIGMTTSDRACQNVLNTSCTLHYRNPQLDNWGSLNVQEVRYEMYNGSDTLMTLTINGSGTTMENWFEHGKTNPISLPWIDMGQTWWAITDWDTKLGRSFRVVEQYGHCLSDVLYTFVLYEPRREPDAPPEDIYCNYELAHSDWPQFLYTLNNRKSNFHYDEYGVATTMAVWVLHPGADVDLAIS